MAQAPISPSHGEPVIFTVSAMVATQAITVHVETPPPSTLGPAPFDALPSWIKARMLAACEAEFRRLRKRLTKEQLAASNLRFADLAVDLADNDGP